MCVRKCFYYIVQKCMYVSVPFTIMVTKNKNSEVYQDTNKKFGLEVKGLLDTFIFSYILLV